MPIIFNVSTWLTLSRVFIAPCVMAAIYAKLWLVACLLLIIAGASDFFDGYYARLYSQETEFGKVLDPVADKVLLFSTLWALYKVSGQALLPSWFIFLIIGKDLVLIAGALFLMGRTQPVIMSPSLLSKWITALFMFFTVYLLLIHWGWMTNDYVDLIIQFFALATVLILSDYSYKFFQCIKNKDA